MTITNYAIKSNDIIFCEKLKNSESDYCIFGIDFDKVITYQVKKTNKNGFPAVGVFITLEGDEEYVLMRSMPSPCLIAVLEKINDNNLEIKEIFDLLICDFELEFQGYFLI